MSGPWTKAEMAVVKQGWPTGKPNAWLMEKLPGRSVKAIQSRAFIMGLTRPEWYLKQSKAAGGFATAKKGLNRGGNSSIDKGICGLCVVKDPEAYMRQKGVWYGG